MSTKKRKFIGTNGFTLIELIIVTVIFAILGTIGFIAFSGFMVSARDSKRISNVNIIAMGFNLAITSGKPILTEDTSLNPNLILSGTSISMTGYYGNINSKILTSIKVYSSDIASGDSFQTYKYSYFPVNGKYQIMALLEKQSSFAYNFIPQTYADTQTSGYVYINGNFVQTGGIVGLVPKPLDWETASGDPKIIDGSGGILKAGDTTDIDPLASLPKGNISGYAWGEGFGWIDFGYISINNISFSGTIWSEGAGWIDFSSNSPNTLTLSWNSGVRKFSGYVWSESMGWINFKTDSINQVYIGSDGYWKGKAWSELGGWIDFSSGTVH